MYLKRLDIQGFKTFATRTIFEFRPGITAIIGPNGSGKSNVADAVRWVLGEQSYSALRSKRTEDLLFSGGGKRAPAGLAEVSLTIDNTDRLLPLPYGEVTLTRRATRAGENEYYINRNRVRLRDLQEAVGPLGGSYTIINQGLVDAALTLRPEERRRLFEDAAEISVFETRKHDAERRLRETAANLERCADVLTALEPRLRSLKRQASLARTHRELSAELRSLLTRQYVAHWRAARTALAAAEHAAAQLDAELQTRRAAQAAATAELRAVREQLRTLREQLGALHAESSTLHTQAEALQRDMAVGNERQAALIRRGEEFARSLQEFELRHDELEHERQAVTARLAEAQAQLAEQRAAMAALDRELAAHEHERRTAQRALENAQRAELEASAALAERRRRAEQLAEQHQRLLAGQGSADEQVATAERVLNERRATFESAQQRFTAGEQRLHTATTATEQARQALDTARSKRGRAEETLAQARRALADAEARLETLTRLHRSYAGTFAGVKAAMQWAESQHRAGFVLVSSIIRTPAELETAIEVALGSRLQNIVVERWADAEEAIVALKRGGQGRATFLPLDSIRRGNTDERQPGGKGVLGVATDLIDFDEHYRPIAQNLLGRTLVVEDLPTARQTLRQLTGGWTIVTLAGEQVNSGGAVTGGAQVKETGTLRRERELRELPEQVSKAQAATEAATQERATIEAQVATAERALREAEGARQRANQDLDVLRSVIERTRQGAAQAETELDLQRRRREQQASALADIGEQQTALMHVQTALEGREAEARANLARLRDEDQGRVEAERALQLRANTIRSAVASAEGTVRAEHTLLQSNGQNLARLAEQRAAGERRVDDLAGERATIDAQLHTLQHSHTTLLEQIDMLRAQISPAETELAVLEASQAASERRESDSTTTLLAAESAHGRATVELQRAHDRLDTLWERAAADDIDIEAAQDADDEQSEDAQAPPPEREELPLASAQASQLAEAQAPVPEQTETLEARIQNLKTRIQRLGAINSLALEEYEEEAQRHTFLSNQIADLHAAETSLRELIAELDSAMQMRFEATFRAVAVEFERSFMRLFGGGHAQLLLTRPGSANADDLSNGEDHETVAGLGVEIIARPPGKRQQTLSLLSGGERTLTAAALLFAILKVNPSPFCVLDEVDAALDEANVGRFRDALLDLGAQTQFLLVTHNRGTIEAADTIYGVSMGEDGASRVLSLRLEELVED